MIILALIFILFTIVWVFAAGLSPIAIFAGFIFEKWAGAIIAVIGLSIGSTLLYIFEIFLKELIREKFLSKFQKFRGQI